MVLDFAALKSVVQSEVLQHLDHKDLNDVLPNPTAEEIVVWIWERLTQHGGLPLHALRLYETPTCFVTYRGPGSSD